MKGERSGGSRGGGERRAGGGGGEDICNSVTQTDNAHLAQLHQRDRGGCSICAIA